MTTVTTVDTTMTAICGRWGLVPATPPSTPVIADVPANVPDILKYIKANYNNASYMLKIVEALRELYNKQPPTAGAAAAITALTTTGTGLKGSMTTDNAKTNVKAIIPLLNETLTTSVTAAKTILATPDSDAQILIDEVLTAAVTFLKTIDDTKLATVLTFIRNGGTPPTLGGKRRRSKSRKARKSRKSRKARSSRRPRRSRRFKRY
jgi:hypothetical protein